MAGQVEQKGNDGIPLQWVSELPHSIQISLPVVKEDADGLRLWHVTALSQANRPGLQCELHDTNPRHPGCAGHVTGTFGIDATSALV